MKLLNQKPAKLSKFSVIIGTLLQMYGFSSVPIGITSLVMTAGVFYTTVTTKTPWLMWLTPVVFLILMVIGMVVYNFFVYHFIIPHQSAYANYINYKNENPIVSDLAKIKQDIEEIKGAVVK